MAAGADHWTLFCRGDPACLTLVSDGFLGWPHTADGPQDKAQLLETLALYRDKPVMPTLEPVGMSVVDVVAVVHLLRTISGPGLPPVAEQVPLRVLRNWMKRSGCGTWSGAWAISRDRLVYWPANRRKPFH